MVDARYARGGETCESIAERMDSSSESTVWTSPTLHRPSVELRPPCVGKGRAMRPASSTVRRWRGALCGDSCGRSALSETPCFDSREQLCIDQREAPSGYTSAPCSIHGNAVRRSTARRGTEWRPQPGLGAWTRSCLDGVTQCSPGDGEGAEIGARHLAAGSRLAGRLGRCHFAARFETRVPGSKSERPKISVTSLP